MRKFLIFLLLPLLLAASCPSTSVSQNQEGVNLFYTPQIPDTENNYPQEPMAEKSAFDYFRDEKLLVGWNVGNTLDAYSNGRANETGWGNPRINQELFDGIKKKPVLILSAYR